MNIYITRLIHQKEYIQLDILCLVVMNYTRAMLSHKRPRDALYIFEV